MWVNSGGLGWSSKGGLGVDWEVDWGWIGGGLAWIGVDWHWCRCRRAIEFLVFGHFEKTGKSCRAEKNIILLGHAFRWNGVMIINRPR